MVNRLRCYLTGTKRENLPYHPWSSSALSELEALVTMWVGRSPIAITQCNENKERMGRSTLICSDFDPESMTLSIYVVVVSAFEGSPESFLLPKTVSASVRLDNVARRVTLTAPAFHLRLHLCPCNVTAIL
jgi:hypothetical protein